MRVSIVLPTIDLITNPKNDVDVNGANIALWIQLKTYANLEAFESLELFLAPKDFSDGEKISRFAQAVLTPENRGKGKLEIHSVYALGDVWSDGRPRILHTDDLWALSRDRHLRDTYAKGPMAHICDTHCLGHFALHQSLLEVSSLDRVAGDTIIACSNSTAAAIQNVYDLPYEVICVPRRIDANGLSPALSGEKERIRRELGLPEDLLLGLYIGRVTPSMKGELMLLIDALVGRAEGLMITGVSNMEGYTDALRAYAEERGVLNRVFFSGRFAPPDRATWYKAADVFLFPGDCLNEAFGQTTIESLACGVPVIQSAWDGLKDTIDDTAGTLVSTYAAPTPERIENLSCALPTASQFLALAQSTIIDRNEWMLAHEKWFGDSETRDSGGRNARTLFEQKFAPEVLEKEIVEVLKARLELARSGLKSSHVSRPVPLKVDYSAMISYYTSVAWNSTYNFQETELGRSWRRGGSAPFIYRELEPLLDLDLLAMIQERVSTGPLSASQLETALQSSLTSIRDVTFHAMFLTKHGFLQVNR